MEKQLILFDFDGTITNKNSLIHFIEFTFSKRRKNLGLLKLIPTFILLKTGLIKNEEAISNVIKEYFEGWTKEAIEKKGKEFIDTDFIGSIIREEALNSIIEYKKEGQSEIYVVTASSSPWVKPWCDKYNIKIISNELKYNKEGLFKGGFIGNYCWGKEKLKRTVPLLNSNNYYLIIAYGDTRGDREMLGLADISYYKPFRNKKGDN